MAIGSKEKKKKQGRRRHHHHHNNNNNNWLTFSSFSFSAVAHLPRRTRDIYNCQPGSCRRERACSDLRKGGTRRPGRTGRLPCSKYRPDGRERQPRAAEEGEEEQQQQSEEEEERRRRNAGERERAMPKRRNRI